MPQFDSVAAFTLALLPLSALNAGISTIITTSTLFEPLRARVARLGERWEQFAGCDICVGTWVGAAIAAPAVWWVGWTGIDAALAGVVVTFSTMSLALVLRNIGRMY